MFGNLGAPELILIFLFILIFFGAKKIPEIAKGLGQGVREFRRAMRDVEENIQKETKQFSKDIQDNHRQADSDTEHPTSPQG
jgi:sec-independent protein translocase protein TatA